MSKEEEPVIGQDSTNKVGRPPKLTDSQRAEVFKAFEDFIVEKDDPRLTNFISYNEIALQYNVTRDNINDWAEFSTLKKKAIQKQEDYLLENGGTGKYNPTIAIFRLKQPQHGYRDRFETDITSKDEQIGQTLTPEQAEQLLRLRAKRADT